MFKFITVAAVAGVATMGIGMYFILKKKNSKYEQRINIEDIDIKHINIEEDNPEVEAYMVKDLEEGNKEGNKVIR